MRVDAGADSSTALSELANSRQTAFYALNAMSNLAGPAAQFLTHTHRHRIHQVRAPGFHDIVRFSRLGFDGFLQVIQTRQQDRGETTAPFRCLPHPWYR